MFRRRDVIAGYEFPPGLTQRLRSKHSELADAQIAEVIEGLRDWLALCKAAKGKFVSMPSTIVDEAWHEFILFTREYERFCRQAFGRMLHHRPSEVFAGDAERRLHAGRMLAWSLACERAQLDPHRASRLPRLFAIDEQLDVSNGITYSAVAMARSASGARRRRWGASSSSGFAACGSGGGDWSGCGGSACGGGGGCGGD